MDYVVHMSFQMNSIKFDLPFYSLVIFSPSRYSSVDIPKASVNFGDCVNVFSLLMKYEQNPYSFPTDFYSPFHSALYLSVMFWNNLFLRLTVQGTVSVEKTSFSHKVAVFLSRMYTKYDLPDFWGNQFLN